MLKEHTISRNVIIEALKLAGINAYAVHGDYTYGLGRQRCAAIAFDEYRAIMRFFAALGTRQGEHAASHDHQHEQTVEKAVDLAAAAHIDSAGIDQIVYFLGYALED